MSDVSVSLTLDEGPNITHSLEFPTRKRGQNAKQARKTERAAVAENLDAVVDTVRAALGIEPREVETRHCGCSEALAKLLRHAIDPGNWRVRLTAEGESVALPVGEMLTTVVDELFAEIREAVEANAPELDDRVRSIVRSVIDQQVKRYNDRDPQFELVLSDPAPRRPEGPGVERVRVPMADGREVRAFSVDPRAFVDADGKLDFKSMISELSTMIREGGSADGDRVVEINEGGDLLRQALKDEFPSEVGLTFRSEPTEQQKADLDRLREALGKPGANTVGTDTSATDEPQA